MLNVENRSHIIIELQLLKVFISTVSEDPSVPQLFSSDTTRLNQRNQMVFLAPVQKLVLLYFLVLLLIMIIIITVVAVVAVVVLIFISVYMCLFYIIYIISCFNLNFMEQFNMM